MRAHIGLALLLLGTGAVAGVTPQSDAVVHEWGTFLAVQGSDGVTLDGMYHEEHGLPQFVHSRRKDQVALPTAIMKGETPVIYFYTDRPQKLRVDVRFPQGIWTQWYPQASVVAPGLAQTSTPPALRNGRLVWCPQIIPAGAKPPALPQTSKDALWNFAREVDAAYVKTHNPITRQDEHERYLFYRGLGSAPLPLTLTPESGGTLQAKGEVLRHLFVLRVENGRGAFQYIPELRPGARRSGVIPSQEKAQPVAAFTSRVADELADRLVTEGLFPKEARAMVNTWRSSYFQMDGVRVLFTLPQAWTDRFIPLTITPRPRKTVRVMVGRLELLTPEREQRAERAVRDLASAEAPVREAAFNYLREQGRYVEPVVRRVMKSTTDEQVRAACNRLLLTDFVTELRTAVTQAADGRPRGEDKAEVRAQLAALLREIGENDAARTEGEAARAAFLARKEPPITNFDARIHLRGMARALEGMGDTEGAARAYGRYLQFAAQIGSNKGCVGCHVNFGNGGPGDMAWYRDWWAGRKYAQYQAKVADLSKVIAEQESRLVFTPKDLEARLKLAFLYQAQGKKPQAEYQWHAMGAPTAATARR